jgi:hypothetical protein
MKEQPRIRAQARGGKVVLELTNGVLATDGRSEGHRWEAIAPNEAVALIGQLVSAIQRAQVQSTS